MIKSNVLFFVCFFILSLCVETQACLVGGLKAKNMQLLQIGKNTRLNGSSVQMFELSSPSCGLECYMDLLNKKNIKFSKQGTLFYIAENGGITIQLFSVNQQAFSGRVICPSQATHPLLNLPKYIKLKQPSTDFQSEDAGEINRTMVFKNFNRTDYQALTQQIQRRSKSSDVNQAFSYFDLGNGHDVNLIFDMRKSINTLVVIYIKKSLSHAK